MARRQYISNLRICWQSIFPSEQKDGHVSMNETRRAPYHQAALSRCTRNRLFHILLGASPLPHLAQHWWYKMWPTGCGRRGVTTSPLPYTDEYHTWKMARYVQIEYHAWALRERHDYVACNWLRYIGYSLLSRRHDYVTCSWLRYIWYSLSGRYAALSILNVFLTNKLRL